MADQDDDVPTTQPTTESLRWLLEGVNAVDEASATMPEPAAPQERHETYCQVYVYNANAALAARQAGYAPGSARQQGHRLLRKPGVAARIAEIREGLAQEGCRSTATLLGKLENIYNRALEAGHYIAAARTVEIQSRLAGFMPSMRERMTVINQESEKSLENRDFGTKRMMT